MRIFHQGPKFAELRSRIYGCNFFFSYTSKFSLANGGGPYMSLKRRVYAVAEWTVRVV